MDITVKGRRTHVSDKFRQHVETKLNKLSKWERKGMSVDVEVSKERNPRLANQRERIELTMRSSGPVVRGEAAADDRYAALDLALDRIEARLRRDADRRKVHSGSRTPVSVAAATADLANSGLSANVASAPPSDPSAADESEAVPEHEEEIDGVALDSAFGDDDLELDTQGGNPLIVREKFHRAKPMSIDQALLEMELVGHDFYLFHDEKSDVPSVVYRRKGFNYGVLRLIE
ncbi:ribosome hibernation-promoting factor, HPF/YfiA family [Salinactinospora qingdaonensis]|uniref:Ribosome hibernation promoting factor n=1 Tax=Salinactinospora qingdaonensis TaxID=702744 RepID=A0ABP7G068_9ACTN